MPRKPPKKTRRRKEVLVELPDVLSEHYVCVSPKGIRFRPIPSGKCADGTLLYRMFIVDEGPDPIGHTGMTNGLWLVTQLRRSKVLCVQRRSRRKILP